MIKKLSSLVSIACVGLALTACKTNDPLKQNSVGAPQIISVKKIWDAGQHNAFTDLIQFDDQWFCTFREADAHVGGDGKIRVLVSQDGEKWESAALLAEAGIDLRDPKFSITPDNRLMLVLGGSVYEGRKLIEKQPRVSFSKNGRDWTAPRRVCAQGDWLWRVTWNKGRAYGIVYNTSAPDWAVNLVGSDDGINFTTVTSLEIPDRPNEATLRFLDDGNCVALVRRESGDKSAWIGVSSSPYREWKWNSSGMSVGGPNFIVLPDSSMIVGGRQSNPKPTGAKTFVGKMDLKSVTPELILPSGGDCSYPGLAWHKGILWMSYYSSHEGKTSIYLAKVTF